MSSWAAEHFPGDGDVDDFTLVSESLVTNHFQLGDPPPQMDVNKELARIRDALHGLSHKTRSLLHQRELLAHEWQHHMPRGDLNAEAMEKITQFTDEYMEKITQFTDRETTLDKLTALVADEYQYPVRSSAMRRHDLIFMAAQNFTNYGGKITAGANSPFGLYVAALLTECGMGDVIIPDAIRAFMKKR